MEQLGLDIGRALRDVGMGRTLARERDAWLQSAIGSLRVFAILRREFRMEEFRAWYAEQGYAPPHDHHVWGAITNRAANAGVIRFTGRYEASESPKTHAHPVKIWEAA